jgi:hypothetical protein
MNIHKRLIDLFSQKLKDLSDDELISHVRILYERIYVLGRDYSPDDIARLEEYRLTLRQRGWREITTLDYVKEDGP